MEATTKEIPDWRRNLKGHNKRGQEVELAPKSRNHYRNSVVRLFNYARDHGYLPKGMSGPPSPISTGSDIRRCITPGEDWADSRPHQFSRRSRSGV